MSGRFRIVAFVIAAATTLVIGKAVAGAELETALRGVDIVSVHDGSIARDRMILLRGNRIAAVLPDSVKPDAHVRSIHLDGAYVIPGLTDSHVHIPTDAIYRAFGSDAHITLSEQERAFAPFIASGVTSLVVMSGAPDLLTLRDAIDQRAILGPRLVVASPMIAGDRPVLPPPMTYSVLTARAGSEAVRQFASDGYDFIKTREDVRPEVEGAMVDAANALGLPLFGHVPEAMPSLYALLHRPGFNFAHLYLLLDFPPYSPDDPSALVSLLARSHAVVMTTMMVHQNILAKDKSFKATLTAPGAEYVDSALFRFWTRYPFHAGDPEPIELNLARQKALLPLLVRGGVTVLAGTDAGSPTIVPGYSFPAELALLVDAGLSPLEALRTATVAPAQVFARLRDGGCVDAGCRADLTVLAANPLLDIHNLSRLRGVVVNGRWLDEPELASKLRLALRASAPHP